MPMRYTLIRCKLILLGGKCDLPPNLWALIGGIHLIPPNYLGVIRRLAREIYAYETPSIRCMPMRCPPVRCTPVRYTLVRYTPVRYNMWGIRQLDAHWSVDEVPVDKMPLHEIPVDEMLVREVPVQHILLWRTRYTWLSEFVYHSDKLSVCVPWYIP